MSDPFIGQVMLFAGTFAPQGWAFCDGQLLSIASNTALFSIIGTIYGGDGESTFALPDLRGRVPVHEGNGPGLQPVNLGQKGGSNTNTLITANLPSHNHTVYPACNNAEATLDSPVNAYMATGENENMYSPVAGVNQFMSPITTTNTGNNSPVNNMQPFLGMNYIIALFGIFPSPS